MLGMNRKEFLASALTVLGAPTCCAQATSAAASSCEKKYGFAQTWAKRMIDIFDRDLDQATRTKLMHTMGRTCFAGAHGERPAEAPKPGQLDRFITALRERGGPDMVRREANVIHFQYIGNPAGLKVSDGYCLCPVVEKGPEGLSGTFCECSVGYVTEMFQRQSNIPVKVELIESLKRGGKRCRFKIALEQA